MLTKKELRRLAKEARVLAMECVEGTAPPLLKYSLGEGLKQHCAMGWIVKRVCGSPIGMNHQFGGALEPHTRLVVNANNGPEHTFAVVFPLLALADALEDASKASPRP